MPRKKIAVIIVIIALSLAVWWLQSNFIRFIFTSPYFNLREINISGQRLVKPEDILSYSRVALGSNIFKLDIARSGRMVAAHPLIKEAIIIRRLPGTLDIKIRERRQVAYIMLGEMYGLDEEGVILPLLARETRYPMITGLRFPEVNIGDSLALPGIKAALNLLRAISETKLNQYLEVAEINVVKPANLVFYTAKEKTEIRLGSFPLRQQLESLKVIWVDLREKMSEAEYIDLRFGEKMVVKPREKK